ncbi:hypothetical protein L1987_79338 [Smallanthus sonchifolius]|uniref:Uncharacterized protein n=1 Tax=Smallanthus sonchifolius TaxID=185202 RepID=A0ACB8ZJM6_9ASTR|nr:hypothetical protein L1987_79338 [Smallanthus sonchifolius]
MAVFALSMVVILAMVGYSSAVYCICNSGQSDSVLQKNIDYACGNGADCAQILQNGACFNPNTVKDHCNYAVNSYYQRKSEAPGSCDFSGTASPSQTAPPGATSACYAGSPSSTTPTTSSPPGTGTGTGTGTGNGTGTGTNTGTGTGTGTGTVMNPPFGLGPTGGDNSAAWTSNSINSLTLMVPGLILWLRLI